MQSKRIDPNLIGVASVNSAMFCMMQGICGQCVQENAAGLNAKKHIFSCAQQDQTIDEIDFHFLQERLAQNRLLEKMSLLVGDIHK
jgi:hypothetical protein